MDYEPLSDELERTGKASFDSAYRVHKGLGPGLPGSVYEECMIYGVRRNGLNVDGQGCLPMEFDGQMLARNKPRIERLAADEVVVENRAVAEMIPLYPSQALNHPKVGKSVSAIKITTTSL